MQFIIDMSVPSLDSELPEEEESVLYIFSSPASSTVFDRLCIFLIG